MRPNSTRLIVWVCLQIDYSNSPACWFAWILGVLPCSPLECFRRRMKDPRGESLELCLLAPRTRPLSWKCFVKVDCSINTSDWFSRSTSVSPPPTIKNLWLFRMLSFMPKWRCMTRLVIFTINIVRNLNNELWSRHFGKNVSGGTNVHIYCFGFSYSFSSCRSEQHGSASF